MTQAQAVENAAPSEADREIIRLRRELDRLSDRLARAKDSADEYQIERDNAVHELKQLQREHAEAARKPFRPDMKRIDAGDWTRACSLSVCDVCGYQYWEHADVPGFEWIHRLCDGRLVKL